MFKKAKRKNIDGSASVSARKRELSPVEDDDSSQSVHKAHNETDPDINNNEDDDSTSSGAVVVAPKRTKTSAFRNKTNGINNFGSNAENPRRRKEDGAEINVVYETSGKAESLGTRDGGATRLAPDFDDNNNNNGAKIGEIFAGEDAERQSEKNLYRGQKNYTNYMPPARESRIKVGPSRGNNVRVTSRFDYQPDICKDYKETGYCGYGDSCIFLHDRGDYKAGWQLDKDWDAEQKAKLEAQQGIIDDSTGEFINDEERSKWELEKAKKAEDDELPFACLICRKPFKTPVQTNCEHYFCQSCAIAHFRKSPKCFACGAATNGIFKPAKKIIERQKQQNL